MRSFLIALLLAVVSVSCTGSASIEEGFVEVDGGRLFYKTMGSGDPIVVLHGGPGFDHRQFLPYIWQLAEHHKVILFDQRGTGLSSGPVDPESISIDAFIEDIESVRRAFGIEKMNLVGHSWGGILAMHYGVRHPDKLKTLILCSTAATVASFAEMRANYEADRLPEDAAVLQEIYSSDGFKNGDPDAIESFWRMYFKPYFADQSLVSGLDLHFTENTIEHGNAVAGYLLQSVGDFDLHADLQVIRCPTLVIHGDADPMPVTYAELIHDSIESSDLVVIEGAGHWLFVDGTDDFVSAVGEFLSDHPGS